jgi:hypothetical protein
MFARLIVFVAISGCICVDSTYAQSQTADERRPLIARDTCLAMATKFASGDTVEFENGRFRVVKGAQSVTVYEGAVSIASIPGFTYSEFNRCLDIVISSLERARPSTDSKVLLEAFMAGYELSDVQNVGICIQSAAMGGFYIGDRTQGNVPLQRDRIEKFVLAVSTSVARRVKRFSNRDVALDLVSYLRFYNYYPDRVVPYFSADAIQSSTEVINDVTTSNSEDYFNLGRVTGGLKRGFLYATFFTAILDSTQGRGDDRSFRAQNYLPSSLQCLRVSYEQGRSRLYQASRDLGISLQIPDFAQAVSNGHSIAGSLNGDNSWTERYFDERVTTRIRQLLRNT